MLTAEERVLENLKELCTVHYFLLSLSHYSLVQNTVKLHA